jgi:two-component system cell cycle sensor histidine kinase/response regulator CckA
MGPVPRAKTQMNSAAAKQHVRVLIIDDRLSLHDNYCRFLRAEAGEAPAGSTTAPSGLAPQFSFAIDAVDQGAEGLARVQQALEKRRPYALAIVTVLLPPAWDGLETVRQLWAADPHLQIVIVTADAEGALIDVAGALGHPEDFMILRQPFEAREVRQMACVLARKWLLAREVQDRTADLDETVRSRSLEVERAQRGFAEVFNASPLAQSILALDRFEVIAVNTAYEKILGFSAKDLKQTTPESFGRGLDPSRWRALMIKLAAKEPVDDHPFVYQPSPGVRRDMRCSARALTVLGRPCSIWVIRDVTDQLRLEEQLRQTQKMDAIGQLAAGVAHDFNNLLTAIQGFTQQAMEDTKEPEIRALLEPVLHSAKRASSLTRQLLVFSRKQAVEIHLTEVTKLLRDMKSVIRCLLPETIELIWDLPASLPMVLADAANIEQIILNLAINARDALPAKGGSIRISGGLRRFATAEETGHTDGRAGNFVTLQVTDNGSGIPPEVLPHIFEPFFTTKDVGKGTGLGLSTVYSIARQHNGWIDIETAAGRGTTFTIFQPVAEPTSTPTILAGERPAVAPAIGAGGGQRVLAVDDDPDVRSVLRLVFDRYNINAVIECDATSALKTWDDQGGQFDLLITDVVMPNGHNGIELARILRQREPELKVILITGYSPDLVNPSGITIPGREPQIMRKPFDLADVISAITAA